MSVRVAYSIREFSEETGMNRVTTWRHCRSGVIPSVRIGRNFLIPAKVLDGIREGTLVLTDSEAKEGTEE